MYLGVNNNNNALNCFVKDFFGSFANKMYQALFKCILFLIYLLFYVIRRTAVVQRLRCCAKNRKVAGSIPAGVTGT